MRWALPIGRLFFAIGLAAFGVQAILFGDFVAGRAPPWPASFPGRLVWAYLSGAIFVAAAVAIVTGRKARPAALLVGTIVFCWALIRNVPVALADTHLGGAWTHLGKALVLFGGAFAVAGSLEEKEDRRLVYLGRYCLGAFLVLCGIQHFLFAEFVQTLVPAWIPGAMFWTQFAGVALIAGGAGLMFPPTARLAGALSGAMVLSWVFLVHLPRALAAPAGAQSRNEWIAVFEALAFAGLAWVLAGARDRASLSRPATEPAHRAAAG